MQRIGMMAALVAVSACGGGSAAPMPDGPAHLGVVAGNHQVVPAAPDARLPQDVVAQVVRLPNGSVALRVLDAVLPEKAYAQTAVNGIAGQVVCASVPDPKHALRAEVACATSDALGKAYFVFHNDSIAGTARGQIAAALSTGTKITDSVSATVMPAAPYGIAFTGMYGDGSGANLGTLRAGIDTVDLTKLVTLLTDKYQNSITGWTAQYATGVDSVNAHAIPFPAPPSYPYTGNRIPITAGLRAIWFKLGTLQFVLNLATK